MHCPWFTKQVERKDPIVKVPLQFYFEPVEIISKQLTKLNCSSNYRIIYLGPRWENSQSLHKVLSKKHGYQFDERRINNNNTFFSESMCSNQFYRNQVYYRAFEGMNPTIDRDLQLRFDSKFQSGNLDCVVKVAENQYDLFLRVDSNTKGHLFWFYFEVTNAKPGTQIKFNLCNMTKSMQLYEKGFKPYSSNQSLHGEFQSWTQENCRNVKIQRKNLRYDFVYEKIKVRTLYQLSFSYYFSNQNPVRFAYCIPFTYTKMVKQIQQLSSPQVHVGVIGRSLTGIDIPIVQIGNDQESIDKPVIFAIGRAHPGQSNGSHVISGFMKYICGSPQMAAFRQKIITIIIPMINPDGVILGNSRTGASGKDLNREFKTKNKYLFPEVDCIKRLAFKILLTHDIQMFLDFHGHSRKKNMFLFGPNYNLTQPEYYKARIMPKFLSQMTSIFRYYGCVYSISPSKYSTARAVMLNQMGIPFVYTVQTSVGQYFDYDDHKDKPITGSKYRQLGNLISKAIQMYMQSIQQYQEYISLKKQEIQPVQPPKKKGMNRSNDRNSPQKLQQQNELNLNSITNSNLGKNFQNYTLKNEKKKMAMKDLKFLKILEQIKILEDNKPNKKKEDVISDASSDSQDEKDNLEKNKMNQFQGMVTQCIQTQNLKQKGYREMSQPKKLMRDIEMTPKKIKRPRRTLDINGHMKQLLKSLDRGDMKFTPNHRQTKSLQPKAYKSQPKTLIIAKQDTELSKNIIDEDLVISDSLIYKFESQKKNLSHKMNRLNLRMFNFSEIIEDSNPRTIMTCSRQKRDRYMNNASHNQEVEDKTTLPIHSHDLKEQSDKKQGFSSKYYKMNLEPSLINQQEVTQSKFSTKNQKQKGIFPAPFYRIKYQNYQRKKQKIFQEKQIMLLRADEEIIEMKKNTYHKSKKRGVDFLNIKKAPQE